MICISKATQSTTLLYHAMYMLLIINHDWLRESMKVHLMANNKIKIIVNIIINRANFINFDIVLILNSENNAYLGYLMRGKQL